MRFGLDWFSLPLMGLLFWAGSSLIGQQLLNRTNRNAPALQVQPQPSPSEQILAIKVEIDPDQGVSQVSVRAVTRVVEQQGFKVSATEVNQIEAAIAQQLQLSPQRVKALTRYQIKD